MTSQDFSVEGQLKIRTAKQSKGEKRCALTIFLNVVRHKVKSSYWSEKKNEENPVLFP